LRALPAPTHCRRACSHHEIQCMGIAVRDVGSPASQPLAPGAIIDVVDLTELDVDPPPGRPGCRSCRFGGQPFGLRRIGVAGLVPERESTAGGTTIIVLDREHDRDRRTDVEEDRYLASESQVLLP